MARLEEADFTSNPFPKKLREVCEKSAGKAIFIIIEGKALSPERAAVIRETVLRDYPHVYIAATVTLKDDATMSELFPKDIYGLFYKKRYTPLSQQLELLANQHGLCACGCGGKLERKRNKQGKFKPNYDIDHIIRRADGGRDTFDNKQLLLRECHTKGKTAVENRTEPRTTEDWLQYAPVVIARETENSRIHGRKAAN